MPMPSKRWLKKACLPVTEPGKHDEDPIDAILFPSGVGKAETEIERSIELYKLMVASSESLVARRQGVNTFFLTANGVVLTATGLLLGNSESADFRKWSLLVLAITGLVLAGAWHSLIRSFGQLNTGKFVVINRIEKLLPVAVYQAEWKALGEGKDSRKYRSFTSRETWVPSAFMAIYVVSGIVATGFIVHPILCCSTC